MSRPDPAAVSTGPVQVVTAGLGSTVPVNRSTAPPASSVDPADDGVAPTRAASGGRSSRGRASADRYGARSSSSGVGNHAPRSASRAGTADPAAVGNPAVGNPAVGDPRVGDPRVGDPRVGEPTVASPAVGNPGPAGAGGYGMAGGTTSLRAAPGAMVSDAVAVQVAREYAPDAEIRMGEPRWWQHRRKVTVVRSRSARRLVRRLDTWTVFKVSLIFYLLMLLIVLVAGIVAWRVAGQVGFITDIQKGVRNLADDRSFTLRGGQVFKYSLLGGAALAVAGTILNVVAAMLYNLISDIVGGLQVIVVTEPD